MDTLLVDPSWLTDSFEFFEFKGRTRAGGLEFNDPVNVTVCKIDESPKYAVENKQSVKYANAMIYCYAAFTEGISLDKLKEKSKVSIGGKDHQVTEVRLRKHISSGDLFSVEMVVL